MTRGCGHAAVGTARGKICAPRARLTPGRSLGLWGLEQPRGEVARRSWVCLQPLRAPRSQLDPHFRRLSPQLWLSPCPRNPFSSVPKADGLGCERFGARPGRESAPPLQLVLSLGLFILSHGRPSSAGPLFGFLGSSARRMIIIKKKNKTNSACKVGRPWPGANTGTSPLLLGSIACRGKANSQLLCDPKTGLWGWC